MVSHTHSNLRYSKAFSHKAVCDLFNAFIGDGAGTAQTVIECPATPCPAPGWTLSRGLSFHPLLTISLNTQITRHVRRATISFPDKSCTSGWQFGYKDFSWC